MSNPTRYYVIQNKNTGDSCLLEAKNKTQALRHMAEKTFSADIATPHELVEMMASGMTVEKAGDPDQSDLLGDDDSESSETSVAA